MKPTEARPADWRLYYNNTWMRHETDGPLFVQMPDDTLCGKGPGERRLRRLDPEHLSPLWLRPGAYNVDRTAVYIGRRARRSARRSMSTEHYHVKWSSNGSARISGKYLWAALQPQQYVTLQEAIRQLNSEEATARAINREIILAKGRTGVKVVLRGQVAGYIKDNLFVPQSEIAPLAKLARSRLSFEGVLC